MFQLKDATGRPMTAEFLQPIDSRPISLVESTMTFIGPLHPTLTGRPGEYGYVDPARGSGWLRLEGYGTSLDTVDGLVRTLDISRSIGSSDPRRPDELGILASAIPRTTNPVIQLVTGCVAAAMGIVIFLTIFFRTLTGGPGAVVALVIVGIGLLGVGIWAISIGVRRMRWWRAARAEVARRGESLPEQLKFWN